eukprot:TRINITY_DN16549_c0_g1_i1.p1 TRINITY_DN16549_c0_g1~~TRINITY_DN16549_c0_g1_i1.p1  ORF type:complete len:284 (+),score=53.91 TRINITY_DN16549_c0_g1_i1:93-944(+)
MDAAGSLRGRFIAPPPGLQRPAVAASSSTAGYPAAYDVPIPYAMAYASALNPGGFHEMPRHGALDASQKHWTDYDSDDSLSTADTQDEKPASGRSSERRRGAESESADQSRQCVRWKEWSSMAAHTFQHEQKTTLMIRGIPNRYTQAQVVEELENRGMRNLFDFLYSPTVGPSARPNTGYAFVNFVSPEALRMSVPLLQNFHFCRYGGLDAVKPISFSVARTQGLEENVMHCLEAAARATTGTMPHPPFIRDLEWSTSLSLPQQQPPHRRPTGPMKVPFPAGY